MAETNELTECLYADVSKPAVTIETDKNRLS